MPSVTHRYLAPLPATLYTGCGRKPVTLDEELTVLDTQLRRLKIEYEIFFSNPTKRPPTDIEWKVLALLRKFSDGARMNFSQRYRYNEMAQRYAVYSDLWRKKSRIREEGYRRPQDALLSVQGVRVDGEEPVAESRYGRRLRDDCQDTIDRPIVFGEGPVLSAECRRHEKKDGERRRGAQSKHG